MIHIIKKVITRAADTVAERISDRDLIKKLAELISTAEIAEHIDAEEVAGHVDVYDVVNNIDMADLAGHLDLHELAEHVERRLPSRETSPAPEVEVPVSDPSLVERLLEKAVDKLLERAEEAARNEEV